MTKAEAQHILLRAFIATGELPDDMAEILAMLIDASAAPETPEIEPIQEEAPHSE